ncbi:MAG: hypothetical protein JWN23_1811 [Rhodocyclales bacterium]|nr:hypothetical protein [Rhodocyclales bacterium]
MNHQTKLSIACTSARLCPGRMAGRYSDELEQRFSFQSYGEDTELEAVSPGADLRALLDKRLLEEMYERLATQGSLDTKDVLLLAHNGVVTIVGTAADRVMRSRIGNCVRECLSVKIVINRLKARDNHNEICGSEDWQERKQTPRLRHDLAA